MYKLLTPQEKYWLGFIATDGSIDLKTKSLSIELAAIDLRQVKEFIKFHKSKATPYYRESRDTYRGRIGAAKFLPILSSYGIAPRKTYTLEVSPLLTSSKEFWLGVMDGDGYFRYWKDNNGWRNHRVTLTTASEAFADQFIEYMKTLGLNPHKYWHKQTNCWKPGVCNRIECDIFLNEIYSSDVYCLERKLSKYLEIGKES